MDEPRGHTPVLTREVCELLAVQPGETVVDATVGLAGHARLLVEAVGPGGRLIGLDVDPGNLDAARQALAGARCRVDLIQTNFGLIREALEGLGVSRVQVILADLGVSSTQLEDAARGFSFQRDGPLDMRMDPRLKTTAADLVNRLRDRELGDLFFRYAQEFGARRIADAICEARKAGRITSTARLSEIVCRALRMNPSSHRIKIHPATRAFLALRMAVNDEPAALDALLAAAPDVLSAGGRIGVIAFHSGEDRVVKTDFRKRKNEGIYDIVTKKPVVADGAERDANPRARSAKLRVAVRLAGEGSGDVGSEN